jgi:hypothetical protein
MTAPEPLDEQPAGGAETRGGDHLADITVPVFAKGGLLLPPEDDDDEDEGCGGSVCDCGAK